MAFDPVRVEDTQAWLTKSKQDLRRVENAFSAEHPDFEDAMFHCQQAAERALKGFLTWHDQPFKKIHDLDKLGGQCMQIDPTLEPLVDRIDESTRYAWVFRYPSDVPEPAAAEAEGARALACQLVDAILARLPEEVRP